MTRPRLPRTAAVGYRRQYYYLAIVGLMGSIVLYSNINLPYAPHSTQWETLAAPKTKRQVVFVMVGAVRSLSKTYKSILHNLVLPLCPPTSCTSHLVAHLSFADNRPQTNGQRDATGTAIVLSSEEIESMRSMLNVWFCPNQDNQSPPHSFDFCHFVSPSYDIGSENEQRSMDDFEMDLLLDPTTMPSSLNMINSTIRVNRMRSLRYADPRRYSMWFSRYWAWKYIESQFDHLEKYEFMFFRPDLLWILPFMSHDFMLRNSDMNATSRSRDVWVHDMYYWRIPDTFAYLPNADVAKLYFSVALLVDDSVACIGGPDLDKTMSKERLLDRKIFVPTRDRDIDGSGPTPDISWVVPWCKGGNSFYDKDGWSEEILFRKFVRGGLIARWTPAGSNIFRPYGPDCQRVEPRWLLVWAEHYASPLPFLTCLMIQQNAAADKDGEVNWNMIEAVRPFRIRKQHTCLTLFVSETGKETIESPCQEHPILMHQIFSSISDTSNLFSMWENKFQRSVDRVELNLTWDALRGRDDMRWVKEYVGLYTERTLSKRIE